MVTSNDDGERELTILSCEGDWQNGRLSFPLERNIALPAKGPVSLAVEIRQTELRFFWRRDGDWQQAGPVLDAGLLSDEAGRGEHASFTGAFVGMLAFDTSCEGAPADFSHFAYEPLDP